MNIVVSRAIRSGRSVPQNLGQGTAAGEPAARRRQPQHRVGRRAAARETVIEAIGKALDDEELTLEEIKLTGTTVDVFFVNRRINQPPKAIGRVARVLAIGMPYSVETFRITPVEDGLPTTTVTVNRTAFEARSTGPTPGRRAGTRWASRGRCRTSTATTSGGATSIRSSTGQCCRCRASTSSPATKASGRSSPPSSAAACRSTAGFPSRGRSGSRCSECSTSPSRIGTRTGRCRRFAASSSFYYEGWTPKLLRLTGDYLFKLDRDIYARASAGMLERAYGGVSGEVLWKPAEQNWGIGAELNWVAQRDTYSWFGFGEYDYDVVMGHASLYWDTGFYGLEAQVDAGRYLAGDWGATLSVQRIFSNGWAIGGYVTRTDITEDEFGEGSYDKGILVTIPLRWATPFETRQTISGDVRSLSSDGGAQLYIANRLYPTIRRLQKPRLEENWGAFWE